MQKPYGKETQRASLFVVLAVCVFSALSSGQSGPYDDDLRGVTTSGKVENNVYSNSYVGFRLRLPQSPCDAKLNTLVDARKGYANLLNCEHVVKGWQGMYTLSIALDYRTNYSSLQNVEQYVRGLRQSAERYKGQKAVQPEEPSHMAGLDFVQVILVKQVPEGTYYQGIACTQLRSYLLCFESEAPRVEAVRALLNLEHKLELIAKATTK